MASNWKKKISRPTVLFRHTRPRSSPALSNLVPTPASEAVKRYDDEAEKCLRELEFEADLLSNGRGRSPSSPMDDIMRISTTTTATTTSTQYISSPDLLGTFCHLMHYVVHLRKENRHLKKQVLCLHEMREIEKLQNELLRSACTCETGASAAAALVDTPSDGSNEKNRIKKHWRHSMPVGDASFDETSMKCCNSTSLAAIATKKADVTRTVTNGSVSKSQIRNGVGKESVVDDEKCEKRSLHGAAGGHKPSAPVTASGRGKAAAASFGAAVMKH